MSAAPPSLGRCFLPPNSVCAVAVEDGDADLELRDLSVEVSRHAPLTQQFNTMHPRLDAAPAVVSAPSSPQRPTKVFGIKLGLVSNNHAGRNGLPWLDVPAGISGERSPECAPHS